MKNRKLYYTIMFLIVIFSSLKNSFGQASSANGTNFPVLATDYLGWNGATGINLSIRHDAGLDIDFYTGGIALANRRIKILGATGHVGIGNGFTPGFRLDVWDDINIAPQAANFIDDGYRIGGNLALYLPGDPSNWENTFVGRAGNINVNPLLPGCYC